MAILIGVILGVAGALVAGLRWGWSRPALLAGLGERLAARGWRATADRVFRRVVSLAKPGGARDRSLAVAAQRLAEHALAAGDRGAAATHAKIARRAGADLPPPLVRVLAEDYAERREATPEAVEAYLAHLGLDPAAASASGAVPAALQTICAVTEETPPDRRAAALALLDRVLAVAPRLEWALYFRGLTCLLDGRFSEASAALSRARELNPARDLTPYWLLLSRLRQPEPDLDAARDLATQFLARAAATSRYHAQAATACAEIGLRLIERLGGFETTEGCAQGERKRTLDEAIAYLEMTVSRQADRADSQYRLGRAYLLAGDLTRAGARLAEAARLEPRESAYAYHLGVARHRAGNDDGAVAALRQAVALDPGHGEAHACLSAIAFHRGDFAAAEQSVRMALRSGASDRGLVARLLCALYRRGAYAEVVREIEARPAGILAPAAHPEAVRAVARSYSRLGKFAEALTWWAGLPRDREAQYYAGCAHAHLEHWEPALACFEALTGGADAWAVRALAQRGHLRWRRGDPEAADRDYRQALSGDDRCPAALYGLGALAAERGDLEEAARLLERAVAAAPELGEARYALGLVLERRGDSPGALRQYLSVRRDGPEGPGACLRAGILRCRRGEYAEALACFDAGRPDGHAEEAWRFYRGTALVMTGRFAEGIQEWSLLRARCPGNERLAANLARAHYLHGARRVAEGDAAGALTAWEAYLSLSPADETTARQIGALHFRLAVSALQRKDGPALHEAAGHLEHACRHDAGNRAYEYYGALCDLRRGQPAQSVARLRAVADAAGADARPRYHLALGLLHQGERREAARLLEAIVAREDAEVYGRYARWALANEALRDGDAARAVALLEPVAPGGAGGRPEGAGAPGRQGAVAGRRSRFHRQATRQYLACLAATGQRGALEAIIRAGGQDGAPEDARYRLGVALALEDRVEDALACLRALAVDQPAHADAGRLAQRLLLRHADRRRADRDWQGLVRVLAELLALPTPPGGESSDLQRFAGVLPLAHLERGAREAAAALWERQLRAAPGDPQPLHHLALLHYWSARGEGEGGRPFPRESWQAAIGYWTVVTQLDGFWDGWCAARTQVWGTGLSGADLAAFRGDFLRRHLEQGFQEQADACRQQGHVARAQDYEMLLAAAVLERKAAACWRQALALLPPAERPAGLLGLPGGPLFFQRYGRLSEVALAAGTLASRPEAAECAARLRLYFSQTGLGTTTVMLEEFERPYDVLDWLDRLPTPEGDAIEARYLRCAALARKGSLLAAQGRILPALEAWSAARDQARAALASPEGAGVFAGLFSALVDAVGEAVVADAQREAGRLKQAGRLDQGIAVLERALALVEQGPIRELLCIYLCDRGSAKIGTQDSAGARADFTRAREFLPDFKRAKEGLATLLNNDGCAERDPTRSIRLLEQALELDPENHRLQRNLAVALHGKAAEMVKAMGAGARHRLAEPIRLLERAAMLPCFNLKPDAMQTIERMARMSPVIPDQLFAQVDDEVLRSILKDLAFLYKAR